MLHHIFLAAEAVAEAAAASEPAKEGLLGTLGINWKLFLAQLVNFAIVLFIFWKWIAKPIAKNLTERQERIQMGLQITDVMEKEKKNFDVWKSEEMGKARSEAEKIIKNSTQTAEKLKTELLTEAQAAAAKVAEQNRKQIESDRQEMISQAKDEIATLVVTATEKILKQKLDPVKDRTIIESSLK
ncbi:MAG: F0F1 ATP synthase subunit B [Acidobacteriaceae bacterium]